LLKYCRQFIINYFIINFLKFTMMKNLTKLKLNEVSRIELEKREMNQLVGGECCGCGCNGPSSTEQNANANWYSGYSQSAGGEIRCSCWGNGGWSSGWS
jgi:natural product precursor